MVTVIKQSEENEKRISIPIVNKFICCFCMPLQSAVNLCTGILIVWVFVLFMVAAGTTTNYTLLHLIFFAIFVICIISLGVFLFGSFKKNVPLMKQIIYIFPLLIIYTIYQIVAKFKIAISGNNNINYEELNDKLNKMTGEEGGADELKAYMNSTKYFSVAVQVVLLLFYLYYYISVYSLIYNVEETKKEQMERRNLENGYNEEL